MTQPFARSVATRPSWGRVVVAVLLLVPGTALATTLLLGATVLVGDEDVLLAGPTDPVYLLIATFAVPLVWVAIGAGTAAWVLRIRPRAALSVTGRFRWRWYAICLVVAVVLGGGGAIAQSWIAGGTGQPVAGWPLLVVIVVLCVPVQAFSEEYVYRGVLLLAIGARTARRITSVAVPIVLTSVLFTLVHPRPTVGLVVVTLVGAVVYAGLTHLTGGLEAASAAHAVWNASALLAVVTLGTAGQLPTAGPLVVGALLEIGLAAMLVWLSRRSAVDHERATDPDRQDPESIANVPER